MGDTMAVFEEVEIDPLTLACPVNSVDDQAWVTVPVIEVPLKRSVHVGMTIVVFPLVSVPVMVSEPSDANVVAGKVNTSEPNRNCPVMVRADC
jgi:hypothetical protein